MFVVGITAMEKMGDMERTLNNVLDEKWKQNISIDHVSPLTPIQTIASQGCVRVCVHFFITCTLSVLTQAILYYLLEFSCLLI